MHPHTHTHTHTHTHALTHMHPHTHAAFWLWHNSPGTLSWSNRWWPCPQCIYHCTRVVSTLHVRPESREIDTWRLCRFLSDFTTTCRDILEQCPKKSPNKSICLNFSYTVQSSVLHFLDMLHLTCVHENEYHFVHLKKFGWMSRPYGQTFVKWQILITVSDNSVALSPKHWPSLIASCFPSLYLRWDCLQMKLDCV